VLLWRAWISGAIYAERFSQFGVHCGSQCLGREHRDYLRACFASSIHSPGMETSLAIYEALIQANVPHPAARRVAECLEKDMASSLPVYGNL
jgi:hypothetical protein